MQRISNNLNLKLAAIALATLLSYYVYVYINFPLTQSLMLDLRIRGLPANLVISDPDPLPRNIEVQLRGPYRLIKQLSASSLSATLDCEDIREPGSYSLRIEVPDLTDVQITDQERKYLDVRVENRAVRQFELGVSKLGQIDENFNISDESLSSHMVTVDGPETLVKEIGSAMIQVHVADLSADLNSVLPVALWDEQGKTIRSDSLKVQPAEVSYILRLIPAGSIKVLNVIPVTVGQPPEGFMLDQLVINPSRVQVEAGRVPDGVTAVPTEPIDLTNADTSFVVSKAIDYPFDTSGDSGLPSMCRISLEIVSLEGRAALLLQPVLEGTEDDKSYILTPPQISVESEELLLLDEEERALVRAVLYVAGMELGEHKLTPQLSLPTNLVQVKINPSTVDVTIIQRED